MAPSPAFKQYTLFTTNSSYMFVPTETQERALTINRQTGEIKITSKVNPSISYDSRTITVYGIIGIISLAITDYIIVVTGRDFKGELLGHDIYRATRFQMLPLSPSVNYEHYPAENYLMSLLSKHLVEGTFWFSYTWDMTRRLQAQWDASDEGKALWETADDRFFWNKYLQSRFIDIAITDPEQKISPFILPILYGTFDIRPTVIKGHTMQLCLISRRSRYRAGTRYFRRGIDHEGHVANFVETEQILLLDRAEKPTGDLGARLSFVQIRGSVPLYWAEINTLRYKPDLQIMELSDTENAMKQHLLEQNKIYGEQNLVNLVNHKGHEKPLKDAFEKYIQKVLQLPRVKYDYFDFHTECKGMRWDRISLLFERIEQDLLRNGYFYQDADRPEFVKLQLGVVRANCMDNLDRTNVAQSAIAKWMLIRQLRDVGVFQEHESVDGHDGFMHDFRNMWADHADYVSRAYSGTGALKTDFTRTGKRSWVGAVDDGVNSVMRYIKNNYFDGPRQDGFDLFTGSWRPRPGATASATLWLDNRPLIVRSMPPLASLSLFMICAGLTLPRTSDYSLTYWFALWSSLLLLALAFIFLHGMEYVAWPRLNPLTDVINYDGPGLRAKGRGRGVGLPGLAHIWKAKANLKKAATVTAATGAGVDGADGGDGVATKHSGTKWAGQEIEMGTLARKRVD